MMFLVYNFFQLFFSVLLFPLILFKVAVTPKYRQAFIRKLGFGLNGLPSRKGRPRIWIHALSVGEVNSSVCFVKELRRKLPDAVLIFSTATLTGRESATGKLSKAVDCFITMPLDLWYTIRRVTRMIRPDIFVLVETDFWPNLLYRLSKNKCQIILLNGRISDSSFKLYQRFRFFFGPMFARINLFAMQSAVDEAKLAGLGVSSEKIYRTGNLKFDQETTCSPAQAAMIEEITAVLLSDPARKIFVAGSTHKGEEEIIFQALRKLMSEYPHLFLVIAPRNVDRAKEILELAQSQGLKAFRRTRIAPDLIKSSQVMVLDTLGELSYLYSVSTVAFVGGSLVPERGHNILEAAAYAKPVLFGPHMEDFHEAAAALLSGGGFMVRDADSLADKLERLLADDGFRKAQGEKAQAFVEENKGAVKKAVDLVLRTADCKTKPVIT